MFDALGLKDILHTPSHAISLEDVQPLWRRCGVRVECLRPDGFEDAPWVGGMIRGMLGTQLKRQEEKCGGAQARPGAFQVLFQPMGKYLGRQEIPKPYVIRWECVENRLFIWVVLFGMAERYIDDVVLALENGLSEGFAIRINSPVRTHVRILSFKKMVYPVLDKSLAEGKIMTLRFATPFVFKRDKWIKGNLDDFLLRLLDRVRGMALWDDFDIQVDYRLLQTQVNALQKDFSALTPISWTRYSSNAPGKAIPVNGYIGDIHLKGNVQFFSPLLKIGQTCHLGMSATFGMGRFEILHW